jgi:hypothetical protein
LHLSEVANLAIKGQQYLQGHNRPKCRFAYAVNAFILDYLIQGFVNQTQFSGTSIFMSRRARRWIVCNHDGMNTVPSVRRLAGDTGVETPFRYQLLNAEAGLPKERQGNEMVTTIENVRSDPLFVTNAADSKRGGF